MLLQKKRRAEIAEQKEIFETIQERKNTSSSEFVSFDEAIKIAGV